VLSGSKIFITNAPVADHLLVLARTSGEDRQIHGGTWFIVNRDCPGLVCGPAFDKMLIRSSPTGEVFLDDVVLSDDDVLGEVGQGFYYLVEALDVERMLIGASTIGIAQACLDEALSYGRQREVFGSPITDYQLVQDKIAAMVTGIELSQTMLRRLLDETEQGRRITKEAAILKLYGSLMAVQAANDAVQIFGGYGCMSESKVSRMYRDAKIHEIGAGTTEIMKIVIAKETMKATESGVAK
jgi:alkylation response protein AidB-like acyl-CoA dehydrogenase